MISCLLIYFLYQSNANEASTNFQPIQLIEEHSILEAEHSTTDLNNPKNEKIMVDIKGAVQYPGVYRLYENDRVIDAIQMAGGYTDEADSNQINHAAKVADEMVIYVPKKGETIQEVATFVGQASQQGNGKININTATEEDFTKLPGIGPSKARAIIEYREQHGKFKTIEDLKNVSGIGEKTFEKLKEAITN